MSQPVGGFGPAAPAWSTSLLEGQEPEADLGAAEAGGGGAAAQAWSTSESEGEEDEDVLGDPGAGAAAQDGDVPVVAALEAEAKVLDFEKMMESMAFGAEGRSERESRAIAVSFWRCVGAGGLREAVLRIFSGEAAPRRSRLGKGADARERIRNWKNEIAFFLTETVIPEFNKLEERDVSREELEKELEVLIKKGHPEFEAAQVVDLMRGCIEKMLKHEFMKKNEAGYVIDVQNGIATMRERQSEIARILGERVIPHLLESKWETIKPNVLCKMLQELIKEEHPEFEVEQVVDLMRGCVQKLKSDGVIRFEGGQYHIDVKQKGRA